MSNNNNNNTHQHQCDGNNNNNNDEEEDYIKEHIGTSVDANEKDRPDNTEIELTLQVEVEEPPSGQDNSNRRRCYCCPGSNRSGSTDCRMTVFCASIVLVITVLAVTVLPNVLTLFLIENDDDANDGSGTIQHDSAVPVPIRVGAFNIRHFGRSLIAKTDAVSGLVQIFDRYDIVLVQEVRDSSRKALDVFLTILIATTGEEWTYLSSNPLGRTRYYKEQYVYFYKPKRVKVVSSRQVVDSARDVYEREPFAVEIEYDCASDPHRKRRVVLLGLHAKPTSAEEELREVAETVRKVAALIPDNQGVILMGDLNADCSYLSPEQRRGLDVFSSPDFVNLIPDTADTTVSKNTDCAYDRVILYASNSGGSGSDGSGGSGSDGSGGSGSDSGYIDASNGGVFNFETFLKIGGDEALEISDHYPVEFMLN